MALDKHIFRTRALSALVFVVLMLLGLLWNFGSFFILFSIIHFGCWSEYQKIIGLIDPEYKRVTAAHKYGVRIAGWCVMLYFVGEDYKPWGISLHLAGYYLGLLFMFVLPVLEILFVRNISLKNIAYSFFGLLYISLSWGLLVYIRSYASGFETVNKVIVIMIVASIWINDTMAYIVGSLIGKTPLTRISPKKTWEGTVGGIILSIVVMGLCGYFVVNDISKTDFYWGPVLQWASIAAIASITGTFGDVLESRLKRMANIKDSGELLPGHGGFLDRFDSLLLAVPFICLYIVVFIK
jgi:phosphatidate cytidylyltransferase